MKSFFISIMINLVTGFLESQQKTIKNLLQHQENLKVKLEEHRDKELRKVAKKIHNEQLLYNKLHELFRTQDKTVTFND